MSPMYEPHCGTTPTHRNPQLDEIIYILHKLTRKCQPDFSAEDARVRKMIKNIKEAKKRLQAATKSRA
jgi:hypothetical protein